MEKNRNAIGDFTEELKSYAEIKSEDIKLAAIEKTLQNFKQGFKFSYFCLPFS